MFAPSIRTLKEPTSVSQMTSRKKLKKFIENFIIKKKHKKAKQDKQKAFFNFDKLIINGQIYRGKETKDLPYYCKMAKNY